MADPEIQDPPKRAVLYARVSTKGKGQDPKLQLGPLRDYAAFKGWPIVGEYVDVGQSGAKASRPQLDRLMEDVRLGGVDVVLVWRFDRFARSVIHLVAALKVFREAKVDFVASQEAIDTSTSTGRMVFHFVAAIAEFEREIISERVRAGMENARRKGVKFGRKPKEIDIRPAVAMLQTGHSLTTAAEATGIPRRTLRRRLEAAGISLTTGA